MSQSVEEQIRIYREKAKKEKYLCENGVISRRKAPRMSVLWLAF